MPNIRTEFVYRSFEKEISLSKLCREYGISRKTGYKWIERYRAGEPMDNHNCAPFRIPNKTPRDTERMIVELREEHPAWGPRKLKRRLEDLGCEDLPSASTVAAILKRNGCVNPKDSQQHKPMRRFVKDNCNDLWQMDFKGDVSLTDRTVCHPLTLLDDHSRFALCLDAKENLRGLGVKSSLLRLFGDYGMPKSILCDNGTPWGDNRLGLTGLDVWMMQLDILPIHIRPYHPQTQGKEERFHLTLDKEVLTQPIDNLKRAQQLFDRWRSIYNNERPHEALKLDVPAKHYMPSDRRMPCQVKEPEYPSGKKVLKVNRPGIVRIDGGEYFLSKSLGGKYVCSQEHDNGLIIVHYGNFEVARLDPIDQVVESVRIFRRTLPKL